MTDYREHILQPFTLAEAITTAEAARRAGVSERTIREWCPRHGIGRKKAGRVCVSAVALGMFLEGDELALDAYLKGDRASKMVTVYYEQLGIPVPPYPETPTPEEHPDRYEARNGVTLARVGDAD